MIIKKTLKQISIYSPIKTCLKQGCLIFGIITTPAMIYDFDQIIPRRSSDSIKWHAYPEDVLPLWVADMDFISPRPVIEALQTRVAHGIFGYSQELPQLREAVIAWVWEHYRWRIKAEDIVFVPGVVIGFNLASHALAQAYGEVLVQTPIYPPMLHSAEVAGMQLREMPLSQNQDGTYYPDEDLFNHSLNPNTRMFLLCNPHNPSGRVFTCAELTFMAEACLRHNVIICSDEIHCDLIYSGFQHIPIASLDEEVAQHTITLIAPSKTFNIAGLEFSIAIIPNRELRLRYLAARRGLVGHPNLMGAHAALAAYTHGEEWLEQVLHYLEGNRNWLADFIHHHLPEIRMAIPEGTYLAWLDCRATPFAKDPAAFFLEHARVALNEGRTFGTGGEGFARLNFGCPRSLLQTAMERMQTAIQRINNGEAG